MNSSVHRIVFLERDSLAATVRRPAFAHTWTAYDKLDAQTLIAALSDATIAIVNKTRMDATLLAQLPQLRLIAVTATGTDNVDLDWPRDLRPSVRFLCAGSSRGNEKAAGMTGGFSSKLSSQAADNSSRSTNGRMPPCM